MPPAHDDDMIENKRYRHAISILVHEQIEVVIDQCLNFEAFAPDSLIMLHVSASASFEKGPLQKGLEESGCRRTIVNPVSLPTGWGSIINAHLANIRALEAFCHPHAMIALNASNDMLLRRLSAQNEADSARFELREISPTSVWYTGRQFGQSAAFSALVRKLGCSQMVGSQIEGSTYPLDTLLRLADRMEPMRELLPELPGVAEEVVFPTWALQHLGEPRRQPFILFRASRMTGLAARLIPPGMRGGGRADIAQKAANRIASYLFPPDAARGDIDAVAAGRPLAPAAWPHGLGRSHPAIFHGIKRIARRYDDPLRTYIRTHTSIERARQDSDA